VSHPAPLRVAVVGAGAFGRNHLRVYRELQQAGAPAQPGPVQGAPAQPGNVHLVAVVDPDPAALAHAVAAFGIPGFPTIELCLAAVGPLDAASVCVPTIHHAAAAAPLLVAGVDLLIEKPLAPSLADADAILHLAQTHNRILQTGHLERFNPAVTAARNHLNRPMFFEAHRLSIFTPRSLDVDVVLDLMIHDLDIVLSLVASPVREVRAVGLPVLSNKVDIANVRLEFDNGCIANFTASRVSTERIRKLRFFQPHQYLSLDFARQDLLMIDVTAAAAMDPAQLAALAQMAHPTSNQTIQPTTHPTTPPTSPHPTPGLSPSKLPVPPREPLPLEIESFLHAVRTRTRPLVSGEDGRAALALALEINQAIAAHAHRTGL